MPRRQRFYKTNNWIQNSKVKLPTIIHEIYGFAHELTIFVLQNKSPPGKWTAIMIFFPDNNTIYSNIYL